MLKQIRVPFFVVCSVLLYSFCHLAIAQESEDSTTIEKPGVVVKITGIDRAYGDAFTAILFEARQEYEKTLGFVLPQTVCLQAKCNSKEKLQFFTDGNARMFLTVNSEKQLGPSTKTGIFNIYGVCHELGHMVMYGRMKNVMGLPEGVGEGWAHYCGSVVVEEVARRLGNKIWPEKYDVAAAEGVARLKKQVTNKDLADLEPTARAAKVFYEIELKHDRKILAQAMNSALDKKPCGKDIITFFIEELCKITKQPKAGDWIPKELIIPRVKWDTKERKVTDDFFADQQIKEDKDGFIISYDDGDSDGKQSIAGSGHAILFQNPKADYYIDSVEVFGCRYGNDITAKDFNLYICDEDFNPLQEITQPYSIFEKGEFQWCKISLIKPFKAPKRFYICLCFNPTASEGIFMAYDTNVKRSHSRRALPYTCVSDVQNKYDWMIRLHLVNEHK